MPFRPLACVARSSALVWYTSATTSARRASAGSSERSPPGMVRGGLMHFLPAPGIEMPPGGWHRYLGHPQARAPQAKTEGQARKPED